MKHRFPKLLQFLSIGLLASMLVFSQVKTEPKTVLFRVSVVDKNGNFVENLKKEQFAVKENGTEQEISYFSDKEEPASVVILLDLSESILPHVQHFNIQCTLKFIRESNSQNEYSIIGFNKEVKELVDWKDKEAQIVEKLNQISSEKNLFGNTRFYDAIFIAFEKFNTGRHDKKVLFILSDGLDNESDESFGKVKKELKKNDVMVYSISAGSNDDRTIMGSSGDAFLQPMAAISGGRALYPINKAECEEILERIVAIVQKQYVIGYVPKESKTKKDWRSVKIKASTTDEKSKEKSLAVRAREGYFAAEEKPE